MVPLDPCLKGALVCGPATVTKRLPFQVSRAWRPIASRLTENGNLTMDEYWKLTMPGMKSNGKDCKFYLPIERSLILCQKARNQGQYDLLMDFWLACKGYYLLDLYLDWQSFFYHVGDL
jgi:hypothetical protein